MNGLRDAGLAYAARGWSVFPVHGIVNGRCTCGRDDCSSPGKHPLVRRGVHEATTNPRTVGEWWGRWCSANVGMATGKISGMVVVDIDVPEGERSLDILERIGRPLPTTLSSRTGSRGRHLYYRTPGYGLGNTVGDLPGIGEGLPGIDLRGDGGYVLLPPSNHVSGGRYEWPDPGAEIAPAPRWLKQSPRPSTPGEIVRPGHFEGDGTPYGLAALQGEFERLRSAPKGCRNHTLNRVAFSLAQLVAGGELLESAARSALLRGALRIGLTEHESRATIDSGFDAGMQQPRVARHRLP